MATKDATKLRTYNHPTITQLGRCRVEIAKIDKYKSALFFEVPGNGKALLGIPDIELVSILNIDCSAIGTEEDANCKMRKDSVKM